MRFRRSISESNKLITGVLDIVFLSRELLIIHLRNFTSLQSAGQHEEYLNDEKKHVATDVDV